MSAHTYYTNAHTHMRTHTHTQSMLDSLEGLGILDGDPSLSQGEITPWNPAMLLLPLLVPLEWGKDTQSGLYTHGG